MKCKRCGSKITEGDIFCDSCGCTVDTNLNLTENMPVITDKKNNKDDSFVEKKPRKKGPGEAIFLILIIIFLIGVIIYLVFQNSFNKTNDDDKNIGDTNKEQIEEVTTWKYEIDNYYLESKHDIAFTHDKGNLYFYTNDRSVVGLISTINVTYNTIEPNLETILKEFEEKGLSITSNYEKLLNNHNIYVFEGVHNNVDKKVVYFGYIDSKKTTVLEVSFKDEKSFNSYNLDILEMISEISINDCCTITDFSDSFTSDLALGEG